MNWDNFPKLNVKLAVYPAHPWLWLQDSETTEDTDIGNKIHKGSYGVSRGQAGDGEWELLISRSQRRSQIYHCQCRLLHQTPCQHPLFGSWNGAIQAHQLRELLFLSLTERLAGHNLSEKGFIYSLQGCSLCSGGGIKAGVWNRRSHSIYSQDPEGSQEALKTIPTGTLPLGRLCLLTVLQPSENTTASRGPWAYDIF